MTVITTTRASQALPSLIKQDDVSDLTGFSPRTVEGWRLAGTGPRFKRIGGRVRYDLSDVLEWLDGVTENA